MPDLIAQLAKHGADDTIVVVGGVIPAQDYDELKAAGVAACSVPAPTSRAAAEVLDLLER